MYCILCNKQQKYLKKNKCQRCYRIGRQLSFGYTICSCGCNQKMPKMNAHLKPMKFLPGHNSIKYKFLKEQLIECSCGCGELIPIINSRNKYAKYKTGHNMRRGNQSPAWKGGKIITSKGYKLIHVPDHPYCDSRGYVFEHRLVYEAYLTKLNGIKTILHPSIIIHHLDHNKLNNKLNNLILTNRKEHLIKYHYNELILRLQK